MMRWAWHVHHNILVEPLVEPLSERRKYIKAAKSEDEVPTRLRLLKPVQGRLPEPLIRAAQACVKAYQDYERASGKTWPAYLKTLKKTKQAYFKALRACAVQIRALHAQECPNCPWDGKTIFSRKPR